MSENKNLPGLSRRAFLGASATALFAGIAVTITGCGTESDDDAGGSEGVISSNHSHRAVVTQAQLGAGATVTLNIQGGSSHAHTVVLSDSQVAAIKLGNQVSVTSSTTDEHSHTVTFN